jgi:hypothetical protein
MYGIVYKRTAMYMGSVTFHKLGVLERLLALHLRPTALGGGHAYTRCILACILYISTNRDRYPVLYTVMYRMVALSTWFIYIFAAHPSTLPLLAHSNCTLET